MQISQLSVGYKSLNSYWSSGGSLSYPAGARAEQLGKALQANPQSGILQSAAAKILPVGVQGNIH
jgi:hypothetical protein